MPNALLTDTPRSRLPSGDEYLHLVITRYNVVTDVAQRVNADGLDPAWLEHRAALFQKFCLPSIERQTSKNFVWLILFHPNTPPHHFSGLPTSARLVFAERPKEAFVEVAAEVAKVARIVVSSRLDNDDALAFNYVECIQKGIAGTGKRFTGRREDFVFCLNYGLLLDTADERLYLHYSPSNSFLSLVEFIDTDKLWRSAHNFRHIDAAKHHPIVEIKDNDPAWMVVLHDRNITNSRWRQNTPAGSRKQVDRSAYAANFPGLSG